MSKKVAITLSEEELEQKMNAIAREVFKGLIEELDRPIDYGEMPPNPQRLDPTITGRGKENRAYHKFSATIDINLWRLLHADMNKHGLSIGRMLDVILWRYYGKPSLSYENNE